jgi:hypothetical protein
MYTMGIFIAVAYTTDCTPRMLWLDQPTPSQHRPMACTISVRHGYDYSRGVHFICTSPLCSHGVQKNLYAPDDNSSYELFPSSEYIHHTYLLAICYFKVYLTYFYLSFELNSFGVMRKLVSKALTNPMAHFTFLAFKILTLWVFYIDAMLASCKLEISQTMPLWGKLSTLHFLFELIS